MSFQEKVFSLMESVVDTVMVDHVESGSQFHLGSSMSVYQAYQFTNYLLAVFIKDVWLVLIITLDIRASNFSIKHIILEIYMVKFQSCNSSCLAQVSIFL